MFEKARSDLRNRVDETNIARETEKSSEKVDYFGRFFLKNHENGAYFSSEHWLRMRFNGKKDAV